MKINLSKAGSFAVALMLSSSVVAAAVTPIATYGNVFPTITESNSTVFISGDTPWYLTFNLVESANVRLGAIALPSVQSGGFTLTNIRIVTGDGASVPGGGGTDVFTNPFPHPIERLAFKDFLSPGIYALEVNGFGNSVVNGCGRVCDGADFTVRLQVTPVPEPGTYSLLLAGLGLLGYSARRVRRSGTE